MWPFHDCALLFDDRRSCVGSHWSLSQILWSVSPAGCIAFSLIFPTLPSPLPSFHCHVLGHFILANQCLHAPKPLTYLQWPMQIKHRNRATSILSLLGLLFDFHHALCPFPLTWLDFLLELKHKILLVKRTYYENSDCCKVQNFLLEVSPQISFNLSFCANSEKGVTCLSLQLLRGSFLSHRQPFPWQLIFQPFNFYTGEQAIRIGGELEACSITFVFLLSTQ